MTLLRNRDPTEKHRQGQARAHFLFNLILLNRQQTLQKKHELLFLTYFGAGDIKVKSDFRISFSDHKPAF